jgi:hypothetical protein
MGKAPAFQFYVRDWLSDPQLRATSTVSKGIWIDLLCFMWEAPERGKLDGVTAGQLAKMTGATLAEIEVFLSEAKTLKFASVTERDKKITLENRRMVREEKERKANADRQARFREKKRSPNNAPSNGKVTSPSSTSSSTTTSTAKKKERGSKDPLVPESEKHPPCPHAEIQRLYHEILPELPRVNIWPEELQKILRTRWREDPERQDLSWWETYFRYVSVSDFLMGRVNEFQADLEWIIRPKNMTKVINGRYHKQNGKHVGIFEWLQRSEEVHCGTERQEAVCNGDGWTG